MINKACVMIVELDILVRHPLAEYLRSNADTGSSKLSMPMKRINC